MELQTVGQVSKTFGISAQMLRYYERSGLLKSLRKDDYAYRVYDDENIKRLQQIIILRKLQIPVKQICVVLTNPDAATAIEIFKKNISELQTEINALSTIKSALEIFVAKIEELAAVRFDLNLLTDESVMKLAESLSLIQKNVKDVLPCKGVESTTLKLHGSSFICGTDGRLPGRENNLPEQEHFALPCDVIRYAGKYFEDFFKMSSDLPPVFLLYI